MAKARDNVDLVLAAGVGSNSLGAKIFGAGMQTECCDRYLDRQSPNRQMLALKSAKVDLSKWKLISTGATPPGKAKVLAEKGFVIIEQPAWQRSRVHP